jgi:hypothetical protein
MVRGETMMRVAAAFIFTAGLVLSVLEAAVEAAHGSSPVSVALPVLAAVLCVMVLLWVMEDA